MSGAKHIPVRTCMGCGQRAPQGALLRVAVQADGALTILRRGQLRPGRTGYLHDQPACWKAFAARKGRVQSLRRGVDRDSRLACVREMESGRAAASTR